MKIQGCHAKLYNHVEYSKIKLMSVGTVEVSIESKEVFRPFVIIGIILAIYYIG